MIMTYLNCVNLANNPHASFLYVSHVDRASNLSPSLSRIDWFPFSSLIELFCRFAGVFCIAVCRIGYCIYHLLRIEPFELEDRPVGREIVEIANLVFLAPRRSKGRKNPWHANRPLLRGGTKAGEVKMVPILLQRCSESC